METKFTPGPWEVIDDGGGYGGCYSVSVEGSGAKANYPPMAGCIASVYDGEYVENHNAENDAHLIAAAPELYAALESARAWADSCGAQAGLQNILDEIDAALAKARGQQ